MSGMRDPLRETVPRLTVVTVGLPKSFRSGAELDSEKSESFLFNP
jgi:hypothetical protein